MNLFWWIVIPAEIALYFLSGAAFFLLVARGKWPGLRWFFQLDDSPFRRTCTVFCWEAMLPIYLAVGRRMWQAKPRSAEIAQPA